MHDEALLLSLIHICFLILSYPITPAIMFLLHKTSVEYTRLYFSIAEVLLYIIEPRIPVSYTHLDVYKRQLDTRVLHPG